MSVTLIDQPNGDLKVVNAARVSFGKTSTELTERDVKLIGYLARANHWSPFAHCRYLYWVRIDADSALRMIQNCPGIRIRKFGCFDQESGFARALVSLSLAHFACFEQNDQLDAGWYGKAIIGEAGHSIHALVPRWQEIFGDNIDDLRHSLAPWSDWPEQEPFTLHLRMPICLARQWMRSNVGIVYNEVSRRYVDDEPEFFEPPTWYERPEKNIKQGCSDRTIKEITYEWPRGVNDPAVITSEISNLFGIHTSHCEDLYLNLIENRVAPEQARMVLPLCTMTEFWMTAGLQDFARVVALRDHPHAQADIRPYARQVSDILGAQRPDTWGRLLDAARKVHTPEVTK